MSGSIHDTTDAFCVILVHCFLSIFSLAESASEIWIRCCLQTMLRSDNCLSTFGHVKLCYTLYILIPFSQAQVTIWMSLLGVNLLKRPDKSVYFLLESKYIFHSNEYIKQEDLKCNKMCLLCLILRYLLISSDK